MGPESETLCAFPDRQDLRDSSHATRLRMTRGLVGSGSLDLLQLARFLQLAFHPISTQLEIAKSTFVCPWLLRSTGPSIYVGGWYGKGSHLEGTPADLSGCFDWLTCSLRKHFFLRSYIHPQQPSSPGMKIMSLPPKHGKYACMPCKVATHLFPRDQSHKASEAAFLALSPSINLLGTTKESDYLHD